MTHKCTLKESFVERLLDEYQEDWRDGEDITSETKQKIKDYVSSKMPEDLKESAECITDYSIWHMAKLIREREGLPSPKHSNPGKGGDHKPDEDSDDKPKKVRVRKPPLKKTVRDLLEYYAPEIIIKTIKENKDSVKKEEDETS